MPLRHSNRQVLWAAFLLCVVCSALVTTATVLLRPVQQANQLLDRQRHILAVAGLLKPDKEIEALSKQIETRLVEFSSGWFVESEHPERFDAQRAARDPAQSMALTPEQDIARIQRRARLAQVYLVRDEAGEISTIILPVYGYGLWSHLYGFLALAGDGNTVAGLSFYQHAETPGLGSEVNSPEWKALWPGKQVYDDTWNPVIRLVKGSVDKFEPEAIHQVDAVSGATLTMRGVENLLHFWLGRQGFGPFLARLRAEGKG